MANFFHHIEFSFQFKYVQGRNLVYLCAFLFTLQNNANSQSLNHALGEIIIHISVDHSPMDILGNDMNHFWTKDQTYEYHSLIPEMNIWKISFNYNRINEMELLSKISDHSKVINAQLNYFIDYRKIPNDLLFDEQWQYLNVGQLGAPAGIDLKMDKVWDITTGGLTSEGDTIVICVIDDGLDPNHADIIPNLWRNYDEIKANGIDDDNNGYIDDFNGWNVQSEDDDIFKSGRHGTSVTGIVGAKGNNTIGVVGMNWDVKLMIISGISDIASVIAAYSYPLKMRKIYNQTKGEKGAFVVSTNASWGIKNIFPEDAPIWCSLYDSLGNAGILNCGAAPNSNVDVDIVGDLPSNCSSDYLIGVTNVNRLNQLENGSGYGATSIDLGAFGEDAFTTAKGNTYRSFGGTSAATPHVTGSIGLLYAAEHCNNLSQLSKSNPKLAALKAKTYLLNNTFFLDDLANKSTTGGRLDILAALLAVNSFSIDSINDTNAYLSWTYMGGTPSDTIRWRKKDDIHWQYAIYNGTSHTINNLVKCSSYQVQALGICQTDKNSYSSIFEFSTIGCCKLPDKIEIKDIQHTSVTWKFSDVFAAESYIFDFKREADQLWTTTNLLSIDSNIYSITKLSPCTNYLFRIQTSCSDSSSRKSDTLYAQTLGCGSCMDLNYCIPLRNPSSASDWIQKISIAGQSYESGNNDGYGDFTSSGPDISLILDSSYRINVNIGNTGSAADEIMRAWIDYNQDGEFNDMELIIAPSELINQSYDSIFKIPSNAIIGNTRMRILIKWPGFDNTIPEACDEIEFGEIEDYCVTIDSSYSCTVPTSLDTSNTTINSITLKWDGIKGQNGYVVAYRQEGQNQWLYDTTLNKQLEIIGLAKCSNYQVRVRKLCDNQPQSSPWTSIKQYSTRCTNKTGNVFETLINIYPNPFSSHLTIDAFDKIEKIEVYNGQGGKIYEGIELMLNTENWSSGVHVIVINTNSRRVVHKVVKL